MSAQLLRLNRNRSTCLRRRRAMSGTPCSMAANRRLRTLLPLSQLVRRQALKLQALRLPHQQLMRRARQASTSSCAADVSEISSECRSRAGFRAERSVCHARSLDNACDADQPNSRCIWCSYCCARSQRIGSTSEESRRAQSRALGGRCATRRVRAASIGCQSRAEGERRECACSQATVPVALASSALLRCAAAERWLSSLSV